MDEMDEIGQDLDRSLRIALTIVGQLAERTARRNEARAREIQRVSADRARRLHDQMQAEMSAARTIYRPAVEAQWWKAASYDDAATAWQHAAGWSAHDPQAKAAAGVIREHAAAKWPNANLDEVLNRRPMDERRAIQLANEAAPDWYQLHRTEHVFRLEADESHLRNSRGLQNDMASLRDTGRVPAASLHSEWARFQKLSGRENVPYAERANQAAREAMAQFWDQTRTERAQYRRSDLPEALANAFDDIDTAHRDRIEAAEREDLARDLDDEANQGHGDDAEESAAALTAEAQGYHGDAEELKERAAAIERQTDMEPAVAESAEEVSAGTGPRGYSRTSERELAGVTSAAARTARIDSAPGFARPTKDALKTAGKTSNIKGRPAARASKAKIRDTELGR